ncbi:MAG TPA: ATP-binding protein [Tepidisphaeraceae bacterium]|nr:ATP-binding protein [Tepidisphaeraceae bacterium]
MQPDAERDEVTRLRSELEAFRLMVDGVKDYAIFMLDIDGRVSTWNAGAERIKGYRAAEIIGEHFSRFYPAEDVAARKPQRALETAIGTGKYEEEGLRVRRDGSTFWASVLITALFDGSGRLRGFSKVTCDISKRKEAEQELLRAKEQAEQANKAKDQFLAVLSHELRTPLTPVLATVNLMEKWPDLPQQVRVEIGTIRRNVELEARLVDDLLDMTRIARGKVALHAEVVDAHSLIRQSIHTVQKEIDRKGLDLLTSLRAARHEIWGDPTRLQQVLTNLLHNAVKFTPEGGSIAVRTTNEREQFKLVLSDTGIGIEPDVLPHIFNPFEQGERTLSRQFGGLGLGLSISKTMVELHQGSLTAASEGRGKGATFTLMLDALPSVPEGPAVAPAQEPPAHRKGSRILFVEDHDDTRRVMGALLQGLGYTVTTAATVAEAIEIAERAEIDLLVSDIGLPDGTGHDVMRHLGQRGIKGIALSGFGMEDDLRRSSEAGFETHLVKPVTIQALEGAVRRVAATEPG